MVTAADAVMVTDAGLVAPAVVQMPDVDRADLVVDQTRDVDRVVLVAARVQTVVVPMHLVEITEVLVVTRMLEMVAEDLVLAMVTVVLATEVPEMATDPIDQRAIEPRSKIDPSRTRMESLDSGLFIRVFLLRGERVAGIESSSPQYLASEGSKTRPQPPMVTVLVNWMQESSPVRAVHSLLNESHR